MPPRVLISILNWNGCDVLQTCLDSLFDLTAYDNFSVVLVDNGSDDGSVSMVRSEFPEVELIENDTNLGFAKGNNQAFDVARREDYDYVLMLNNDIEIIEEDWLTTLVETAEMREDIGVVGCKVIEPNGDIHYSGRQFPLTNEIFPYIGSKYEYNRYQQIHQPGEFEYTDDVVGAVYLIRAEVLKTVGDLDESFSPAYFEESDYSIRVWNAGFKLVYNDDTTVEHLRHQTSGQFDETYFTYIYQRNHLRFILLNYPIVWILLGLPLILARHLDLFFEREGKTIYFSQGLKTNPLRSVKYLFLIYYDLVRQASDIISERRNRTNVKELLK